MTTPSARVDDDPVHCGACPPGVAWSTVNAGEALPGVVTPLTWSLYGDATESGMRGAFADMGVLREAEVPARERPEDRLWALFHGRAAVNLGTMRTLADRTPGTTANSLEHQMFGQVRPGMTDEPSYGRYPVVALKAPMAVTRVGARLADATASIHPWWADVVASAPPDDAAACRALMRDAARRFAEVMRPHTLAALICQGLYEQIRALAEAAGREGTENSLVTGYGSMAETAVVTDVWDASRDHLTVAGLIARHGYHGPAEGELSSRPWRTDDRPVRSLVEAYRPMPEDRDPRRIEADRGRERRDAETALLAALPRARRPVARAVLAQAARLVPLRGVGKASFLQCADVVRFAADVHGARLAESGALAAPADVFLLTLPELLAEDLPADAAERVERRREQRKAHLRTDLPDLWEGMPTPRPVASPDDDPLADAVTGTPVSPGVVEGTVRLVLDPATAEPLSPGEILVCRTTDPSWASTFMLAAALVVDIGGAVSHGAIVARELGIPCVTGTRTGTASLRTGDRVEVDGRRGEVRVLHRADRSGS
jgi:phosphohistidine swiveling domain-containing protein